MVRVGRRGEEGQGQRGRQAERVGRGEQQSGWQQTGSSKVELLQGRALLSINARATIHQDHPPTHPPTHPQPPTHLR